MPQLPGKSKIRSIKKMGRVAPPLPNAENRPFAHAKGRDPETAKEKMGFLVHAN